jgi:hypothetical protein
LQYGKIDGAGLFPCSIILRRTMKSKDAPWSAKEDQQLLKYKENNLSWNAIGIQMDRSRDSCRSHYRFVLKSKLDQNSDSTVIDDTMRDRKRYITTAGTRVSTLEELIAECKIDTTIWECKEFKVHTSEGYRKDKKTD